jgi:nicotinamidase-related amidase
MRRDKTKDLLSIIATFVSIVLILIYWLAPAGETSHQLYKLFIDCIPDSIVVLITIPIVYWLLYTRGLTNMGDCPLFTGQIPPEPGECHSHRSVSPNPRQSGKVTSMERDVLFVAGLQDAAAEDLDNGKIMGALNDTLRLAETKAMPVVFTKCCMSTENTSTEKSAASQAPGADVNTYSKELPKALYKPAGSVFYKLRVQSRNPADPGPENAAMDMLVSDPRVRSVYVTGIAPEYCIRAICRISLQHGKKTIVLNNTIAVPGASTEQIEKVCRDLTAEGVVRQEHLS